MVSILLCLFIGVLSLYLLVLFVKENFRNKNASPGPLRFPLVGSLIQIAKIHPTQPYVAFTKMKEKYGDVISIKLGSVDAVVFNSCDVMEEYLTKTEFSDRYCNAWMQERTFQKRLGIIFGVYPDPWQAVRSYCLRSLREFGYGKRSRMHSAIQDELTEVVYELKESIKENNGIHYFDTCFTISTLNVLWSMLAGRRYEHSDPNLLKLLKIMRKMMESCNFGNSFLLAYPQWKDWFPDWTGMTLQRNCFKEMNGFCQDFIDERRKIGVYETNPENMVDEFLAEIDAHKEDPNTLYTDQQLIAIMNDLFMTGSEASICYPFCRIFTGREMHASSSKLHYVRATLAETHRMATVVPLMGPRVAGKDSFCGKYFIPKGTYIIGNMYGIFRDKVHWKDPDNFRPERFLDDNGKFKSDEWLKPFGFGRRACLGESLASMNLLYYITVLMQNFVFLPVPNEALPTTEPIVGVTTGHHPFRALLKCRT
ncbi:Methyl farnesoate epoxidase [Orchesella cincta]|uniref:Methyl farnesoate epoxidase n=1 Tax=Orchesella cincta TaxID=48709 RepID=A0A1D2MPN9_ORCCI|nr:Methyl farnesoate epoxidase [Orchesella cincta]